MRNKILNLDDVENGNYIILLKAILLQNIDLSKI